MLVALEAEEKNATIGAGILDILPDQFGFETARPKEFTE